MRDFRRMFLATAAVCALAAPAFADEMMMTNGMATMVGPDGKMTTMKMSDPDMSDMGKMMQMHGQPVAPNTMMMMYDGKMYMMPDTKMSNGKMMSDEMMHQ